MFAPLARLDELPWPFKVWALLMAGVQVLVADRFGLAMFLLMFSSAADWKFGALAAKRRGDYSAQLSEWGAQSKVANLIMVLIIWIFEAQALRWGILDTNNMIAVVTAWAFVVRDLRTIDEHRQTLGARPIFLLSALLDWLDTIPGRIFPALRERRTSDTEKRHNGQQVDPVVENDVGESGGVPGMAPGDDPDVAGGPTGLG